MCGRTVGQARHAHTRTRTHKHRNIHVNQVHPRKDRQRRGAAISLGQPPRTITAPHRKDMTFICPLACIPSAHRQLACCPHRPLACIPSAHRLLACCPHCATMHCMLARHKQAHATSARRSEPGAGPGPLTPRSRTAERTTPPRGTAHQCWPACPLCSCHPEPSQARTTASPRNSACRSAPARVGWPRFRGV